MFEKEIKFIVDYTLNKLRKEVAQVNMGRLLNSSIHPAIIQYCSAEIDNQIKIDRNKLLTGSFFDYSGREISRYFNLINEEIRKNYKMKSEDLKKLVIKAASFNANYVVRPGWTLSKFIFSESKEKTISDVLNYFNYIYYYRYQLDVLSAFISKKKITSITLEDFLKTAAKIDKEVISSNRTEILRDGITSIADFFNEGALSKEKVSPYLIEFYFKDKKFNEAAEAISKIYQEENRQKRPVNEIIEKLSAALQVKLEIPEKKETMIDTTIQPQLSEAEPEIIESADQETEFEEILAEEPQPDTTRTIETTEKEIEKTESTQRTEEGKTAAEEIPAESSRKSDEIRFVRHELNGTEQLARFRNEPEKQHESSEVKKGLKFYVREEEPADVTIQNIGEHNLTKQNDIFSFLSKKEIDRIVEVVFNDDQDEFALTVDKIIESESYEKASEILKKVFLTFKVNPYSKDAVMLTSAVANYFNQD